MNIRKLGTVIFALVAYLFVSAIAGCGGGETTVASEPAAPEPKSWEVGMPITTYWGWLGPPITDDVAKQMAEGGFNLIWCKEGELDVARQHGLRVVLNDSLLRPQAMDDPAELEKLDNLVARVKNHPSLYAYYVGDEPSAFSFPAMGKLVAHLRSLDPLHLIYINLLPTYAGNDLLGVRGETIPAYREYLRQFINTVKPDLISYDHYHFMTSGDGDQFFLNLELIREAALDAGVPFMNIIQACRWDKSMRVPNADELRWLNYTSLAYGAQGLSYFVYYRQGFYEAFRENPGQMMRPDGTTTPQYAAVKILNQQFVAIASQLQPLHSLGAYHVGKMYVGTHALPVQAPFRLNLAVDGNSPGMLLGYFGKPGNTGKSVQPTHAFVVNLDYRNEVTTTIIGPGQLEVFDAMHRVWKGTTNLQVLLTLPPGGGMLVRLRE